MYNTKIRKNWDHYDGNPFRSRVSISYLKTFDKLFLSQHKHSILYIVIICF